MRTSPIVSLEDLRRVTPRELSVAREAMARMRSLIDWRERAVQSGRLDPEIDRPAGNWRLEGAANDYMDAFKIIATGDAAAINLLRYYTGFFSGYKLIHFAPVHGLRSAAPPPADVRAAILANLDREQPYVDYYLRLKALLPHRILVDPPWMLGEVGRDIGGIVVNRDTVRWQMIVATLWHTGILAHLSRQIAEHGTAYVVEIGAGHGGLCYHLRRILPQLTYLAVDLPESLLFSSVYLSLTMPEARPTILGPGSPPPAIMGTGLVPNFLLGEQLAHLPRVDLALNFISFGEMVERQVEFYASALSAAMADTGLVFEANDPRPVAGSASPAREIFARHFAHNEPVDWTGIPQSSFERHEHQTMSWLHANRPLETMAVPPGRRAPLLAPPAAQTGPSGLMALWRKARAKLSALIWGRAG